MSKETTIVTSIAIIFLAVFSFLIWKSPDFTAEKPVDQTLLVRDDSRMTGKKGAKVELVEFGDYECPACAAFNPVVKNVISQFAGNPDFNFVFRHFPLPQHKSAVLAAEAAEAAGLQGKYFEMHDMLYEKQAEWSASSEPKTLFTNYATTLKLDLVKFNADMNSNARLDFINADKADGLKIPVGYTPSFYLNGKLTKFGSELEMKKAIEEILKAQ